MSKSTRKIGVERFLFSEKNYPYRRLRKHESSMGLWLSGLLITLFHPSHQTGLTIWEHRISTSTRLADLFWCTRGRDLICESLSCPSSLFFCISSALRWVTENLFLRPVSLAMSQVPFLALQCLEWDFFFALINSGRESKAK